MPQDQFPQKPRNFVKSSFHETLCLWNGALQQKRTGECQSPARKKVSFTNTYENRWVLL